MDMLVEMRRLALLIFMGTLVDVEFGPDLSGCGGRSCGPSNTSRPVVDYLARHALIRLYETIGPTRRIPLRACPPAPARHRRSAGIGRLVQSTGCRRSLDPVGARAGMSDDLIRDQILDAHRRSRHQHRPAGLDVAFAGRAPECHDPGSIGSGSRRGPGRSTWPTSITDYLDAVIKETMRLYFPSTSAIGFVAEDTTISGYDLQAGTRVMASIHLSHRDERYWDAPEVFHPARFGAEGERVPPSLISPLWRARGYASARPSPR